MKINVLYPQFNGAVNKTGQKKPSAPLADAAHKPAAKLDSVQLSSTAKKLQEAKSIAEAAPDIREEKVAEISNTEIAVIYKEEELKKIKKAEAARREDTNKAKEVAGSEVVKEASQEVQKIVKEANKKLAEDKTEQKKFDSITNEENEEPIDPKTELIQHISDPPCGCGP